MIIPESGIICKGFNYKKILFFYDFINKVWNSIDNHSEIGHNVQSESYNKIQIYTLFEISLQKLYLVRLSNEQKFKK